MTVGDFVVWKKSLTFNSPSPLPLHQTPLATVFYQPISLLLPDRYIFWRQWRRAEDWARVLYGNEDNVLSCKGLAVMTTWRGSCSRGTTTTLKAASFLSKRSCGSTTPECGSSRELRLFLDINSSVNTTDYFPLGHDYIALT